MMKHSQTSQGEHNEGGPTRPLWRNRDFLLLWSGQTISTLGTNISTLALPLLALAFTHSPAQAGFLMAMRQVPYLLFSLPAGALIDRWNRKSVMITCDLVRWLALGSVPLAFVPGHLTLLHLYIVAFVEGTAYVLFSIAQISALPHVVPSAHLAQAYALDTTTEYIGTLVGPSVGAFIIGLAPILVTGAMLAYLADSGSYLVSVLSLLFIHISFQAKREIGNRQGLFKEIAQGLRFLWEQPLLRVMVVLTIGSVIIWALAGLLLAFAPSMPVLMLGKFLVSFTWPVYGVTLVSYRLSLTPDALQGRVNSAFRFLSYGSEPLGAAVGGLLLVALGPRMVLGLIAAGFVLSLLAISRTEVRRA